MRGATVAALAALALAAPARAATSGDGPPEPAKNPLTHALPHWVAPPPVPPAAREVGAPGGKVITGREALLNRWPEAGAAAALEQPQASNTRAINPLTHRP